MAYITREDGEHFVIPSYRDVLSAKKPGLLRREILLLSSNYGDYIALQRKNVDQYEVAFSTDPGYLLGETVWHYFKRPQDLVYCEAIPNTFEAILVIVKSGIVYLDGTFPFEAIPDELMVFRTQQNNFEVYIHGDVPISEAPEEGKFAFNASSVKSFAVLDAPVFPALPLVKAFQLRLVDVVLREKGIGVFPLKKIMSILGIIVLLWLGWNYLSTHKKELPRVIIRATDPYQSYLYALATPDPAEQVKWIANNMTTLFSIPGWVVDSADYLNGVLNAHVMSKGTRSDVLFKWAEQNNAKIQVSVDGFHVIMKRTFPNRGLPATIYRLNHVIAVLADSLSYIQPGNNMDVSVEVPRGRYTERGLKVNFTELTPGSLKFIGEIFKNLPIILVNVTVKVDSAGYLSGSINLKALGN
jgi:hypothetical protein